MLTLNCDMDSIPVASRSFLPFFYTPLLLACLQNVTFFSFAAIGTDWSVVFNAAAVDQIRVDR
jgi:hypothetical protein